MNTLSEDKSVELDKQLINEGKLCYSRGSDNQSFTMTDDGIVEHFIGNKLESSFPFSKLELVRECKKLTQEGYSLVEADFNNQNNNEELKQDIIDNPEQVKQDIQNNIDKVDEIQEKQNELNDKINNLLGEDKDIDEKYPEFPDTEFTLEPLYYEDITLDNFNENLTVEQKAYINAYIGTIEEFLQALLFLYEEIGGGIEADGMINISDYIAEVLQDGGAEEWIKINKELLGYPLEEGKSKFYTAENAFDDFLKNAKESEDLDEDGYYEFQMQDLGITKEAVADFKNLLLQKDEVEDIQYDPQNNIYKVKLKDTTDDELVNDAEDGDDRCGPDR